MAEKTVDFGADDETVAKNAKKIIEKTCPLLSKGYCVIIEPFGNKFLDPATFIKKRGSKVHFPNPVIRTDTSMDTLVELIIQLTKMVHDQNGNVIVLPPFPRHVKPCCESHMTNFDRNTFLSQIKEMGDYLVKTPRLVHAFVIHIADLFDDGVVPPPANLLQPDSVHWSPVIHEKLVALMRVFSSLVAVDDD